VTRRTCGTYGEKRHAHRILVGRLKERYLLEGPGVDGRIILKCVVSNTESLNGLLWPRTGTSGGRF
jgi:hypothetical protein